MAATNPKGNENYWFNGLPFEGVQKGTIDEGIEDFWFNGLPGESLYPPEVVPPVAGTSNLITLLGVGS